jgi:hypothetical protein
MKPEYVEGAKAAKRSCWTLALVPNRVKHRGIAVPESVPADHTARVPPGSPQVQRDAAVSKLTRAWDEGIQP